ncbi:MAG: hypothetical protein AAGH79_10105 [Bacteroidota bacterium]
MNLSANKPLTILIQEKGITDLDTLLSYVREIPYGRSSSRTDFSTVITEHRGTCSSKHALVKAISEENQLQKVKLILCMYKMNPKNTPGIGNEIINHGLEYVPEAHCYLRIDDQRIDITNPSSNLSRIENDILEETEISADQVGAFKVDYHKRYIKRWIKEQAVPMDFDQVWKVREACIQNLSVG